MGERERERERDRESERERERGGRERESGKYKDMADNKVRLDMRGERYEE